MLSLMVLAFFSALALNAYAGPVLLNPNANVVPSVVPVVTEIAQPYEFGYQSLDELGTKQHRQEASNGKAVKGSYGYQDPLGVYRTVNYEADDDGFRAVVSSNEPGMGTSSSANAAYFVQPPPPAALVWRPPRLIAVRK